EFFKRRDHVPLRRAVPQRILALQRGDRLDGVGTTDGLRTCLGETEVSNLPFADEFLHAVRDVFDGYARIDAVLVEEIHRVELQPSKGCLGDLLDMLWTAVQPTPPSLTFGSACEAEFRGDDHLAAERRECFAHELLVGERS